MDVPDPIRHEAGFTTSFCTAGSASTDGRAELFDETGSPEPLPVVPRTVIFPACSGVATTFNVREAPTGIVPSAQAIVPLPLQVPPIAPMNRSFFGTAAVSFTARASCGPLFLTL